MVFKKNKISNNFIRYLKLFVLITSLVFAYFVVKKNFYFLDDNYDFFDFTSILYVSLLAVISSILSSLIRAKRLHILIKEHYKSLNFFYACRSFFYGMLLSFTPLRIGELLRFQNEKLIQYKIKKSQIFTIFVSEKVIDIVSILTIYLFYLISKINYFIFFVMLLFLLQAIKNIYIKSYFYSIVAWIIEGYGLYLALIIYHSIDLYSVVANFSLSSLIGALSSIPGGVVISESIFVSLTDLSGLNFLLIIILFRTVIILSNILLGLFFWFTYYKKN